MRDGPNIVAIAALVGDQARAQVLTLLMAGQALTATELADAAGVTRQTISTHLARLVDARLLSVQAQGRHRYFRIADADVAHLLEHLMGVAFGTGSLPLLPGPRDPALRKARVCYDHLAGELGVLVHDRLATQGAFIHDAQGMGLSAGGAALVAHIGIGPAALAHPRRPLCRSCLDWSERRSHLAGTLGSALLARFVALGWTRRLAPSRAMVFSQQGEASLRAWLG